MNVKCVPKKEVYYNSENDFRVVSCSVLKANQKIELSKYGTFTLSGNNIGNLQIGEEANLVIDVDKKSKYNASYILLGYQGVGFKDGKIDIDQKFELEILCRLMSKGQAINVNNAYPRFVNMVLNDEEDKIDYNKIKNVKSKRLPEYIDKVKKDCSHILFYPVCYEHGITKKSDIDQISSKYQLPDKFDTDIKAKPYYVYMTILDRAFSTADKTILSKWPKFTNSQHRCEYACVEVLKKNELYGNTRMNTLDLARNMYQIAPQCKEWIVKAVVDSDVIYYDEDNKYVSLLSTYEAEKNIAYHIKERVENKSSSLPVNWQDYKIIDGFEMTDEQCEILKIVANGNKVGILTGSGGSGKSTSMNALVKMLNSSGITYQLLAPTGIASRRLRETTGEQSSTIHMFLASMKKDDRVPNIDYYIIDEMSMVSVGLFSTLSSAIGTEPNIIFVCDEAQLASISCGNIVQDLLNSNLIPRANLTKIFRYGSSGLATIATDTRMGNTDHIYDEYDDFEFIEIDDNPIDQIVEQYDKLLKSGYKKNEILILSPYNKGNAGTYEINKKIQEKFNPNPFTPIKYKYKLGEIQFKIGDMVINTKNNYHMPYLETDDDGSDYIDMKFCANGDIGIVRDYRHDMLHPDKYKLIVEFDNGMAIMDSQDINNLLLGYSVACHRVQGAQSKAIIAIVSSEHNALATRNLCYVQFSRAQEKMVIISNKNVLDSALQIQENKQRNTWLGDMLNE